MSGPVTAAVRMIVVATGIAGLLAMGGCTRPAASPPGPSISPGDLRALESTVQQINASAGSPGEQRATLERLVTDDQRAAQGRCRAATSTVEFEPAWVDVRPRAGQPGSYTVPTLIRVWTGGRITGTDLTALVLSVDGGVARTTALCVN